MIPLSIEDLAGEHRVKLVSYTPREQYIIQSYARQIENQLERVLGEQSAEKQGYKGLKFNVLNCNNSDFREDESIVEITITILGADCKVILTAVFALEIVNRYLLKSQPSVERELNEEDVLIVALISTLLISYWREHGVCGIHLKSVVKLNSVFEQASSDLIVEESECQQRIRIILAPVILNQLRQRAKQVLENTFITDLLIATVHRVQLEVCAEVYSLSALLSLRPGVIWKLGQEILPTIRLKHEVVGYGNLIVNDKIGIIQ